jgi:hypothetical protein
MFTKQERNPILFTFILLICLMQTVIAEPKKAKLVGYWKFNKNSSMLPKMLEDSSENRQHGIIVKSGTKAQLVAGKSGSAMHFSGVSTPRNSSGGIKIANHKIDFTEPFTVKMWIKLDKKVDFHEFKDIIGNTISDRGPGFRLTLFYGMLIFRSGDGKKYWNCSTNSSKIVIPLDKWFLLAITYDGTTAAIFLNGEKVAEKKMTITPGLDYISVGSYHFGYAYPMTGTIDELKIYDQAQTELEIGAEYLKQIQ